MGADPQLRRERAAYQRGWYLANREVHLSRTRERHNRKRDGIRRFVTDYLLGHPCVDCGESDPIVLDFDHVGDDKVFGISSAISKLMPIERIEAEIAKCVVRCANCHRRKTYHSLGYRSRHVGEAEND